uniref:Uncharacterized protein n=1 Tax=Anopheles atroparvus TaxID=41427 RepID=A0A182INL5_ANOAO
MSRYFGCTLPPPVADEADWMDWLPAVLVLVREGTGRVALLVLVVAPISTTVHLQTVIVSIVNLLLVQLSVFFVFVVDVVLKVLVVILTIAQHVDVHIVTHHQLVPATIVPGSGWIKGLEALDRLRRQRSHHALERIVSRMMPLRKVQLGAGVGVCTLQHVATDADCSVRHITSGAR